MGRRIFKDGDFEIEIITHGQPDPIMAAQAILPLVMNLLNKETDQDTQPEKHQAAA